MRLHFHARAALAAAQLLLLSCSDSGMPDIRAIAQVNPGSRQIGSTEWDTLWTITAGVGDTSLVTPYMLVASDRALFVYDDGGFRLNAFGLDGKRLWQYGRKGSGPEEFRSVRDMELSADQTVMLLDPPNGRILEIDQSGSVVRRISLKGAGMAEQFAPAGANAIVLATPHPDSPFVEIDTLGAVRARRAFPWAPFRRIPYLARQGLTASDGVHWVYAFEMGDGWFAFDGLTAAPVIGRYVEHRDFPVILRRKEGGGVSESFAAYSPCTACDVVMADSSIYVLAGGSDSTAKQIVDEFARSDGRYTRSFRLPSPVGQFTVRHGVFYVVINEPVPAIIALRPHVSARGPNARQAPR